MSKAEGKVKRITGETDVSVVLSAYGSGQVQVNTGLVFFDHLVNSLGFWALFDLRVEAGPVVPGRSSLDEGHHLCEDVGLCVGQALRQGLDPLLGLDSRSIVRFGHALVPMDDALVFAAIDISGRPYFAEDLRTKQYSEGTVPMAWLTEFLRAFSLSARLNLHVGTIRGSDPHHIMEAAFKATGLALRAALHPDGQRKMVPSTKGVIV